MGVREGGGGGRARAAHQPASPTLSGGRSVCCSCVAPPVWRSVLSRGGARRREQPQGSDPLLVEGSSPRSGYPCTRMCSGCCGCTAAEGCSSAAWRAQRRTWLGAEGARVRARPPARRGARRRTVWPSRSWCSVASVQPEKSGIVRPTCVRATRSRRSSSSGRSGAHGVHGGERRWAIGGLGGPSSGRPRPWSELSARVWRRGSSRCSVASALWYAASSRPAGSMPLPASSRSCSSKRCGLRLLPTRRDEETDCGRDASRISEASQNIACCRSSFCLSCSTGSGCSHSLSSPTGLLARTDRLARTVAA